MKDGLKMEVLIISITIMIHNKIVLVNRMIKWGNRFKIKTDFLMF